MGDLHPEQGVNFLGGKVVKQVLETAVTRNVKRDSNRFKFIELQNSPQKIFLGSTGK